jgi:hypothetical protein
MIDLAIFIHCVCCNYLYIINTRTDSDFAYQFIIQHGLSNLYLYAYEWVSEGYGELDFEKLDECLRFVSEFHYKIHEWFIEDKICTEEHNWFFKYNDLWLNH